MNKETQKLFEKVCISNLLTLDEKIQVLKNILENVLTNKE